MLTDAIQSRQGLNILNAKWPNYTLLRVVVGNYLQQLFYIYQNKHQ